MDNITHSGTAQPAVPAAALPNSSSLTPGAAGTPGIAPSDVSPPLRIDDPPPPAPPSAPIAVDRGTSILAWLDPTGLEPRQLIALQAIADGHAGEIAARRAGVSMATYGHWRTCDPRFVAAVNAWYAHVRRDIHRQMLALVEPAREAVRKWEEKKAKRQAARRKSSK